jgi:hypothetical protein
MSLRPHNVRPFRRTLRPPIDGTPDGYRIYRSTDGTNFTQVAQLVNPVLLPGGFFWNDTNLSHGTKYWYRIRPFFDDPVYGRMNGHTTEKVWSCTVLPGAADVAVQPISGSSARVSWVDQSDTETGFEVRRYDPDSGQWSLLTTVGAGVTDVVVNSLPPDTTLYLSVRSINVETHSASSEIAPTITPPAGAGMVVYHYELAVDQNTGLLVDVPGVTVSPNRIASFGGKRIGWLEPGQEFSATLTNLPAHDWATIGFSTQAIAYNPIGVESITPLTPPTTVQTWVDATRVQHRVQAFVEQGSTTPGFFGSVLHKEPTLTVRSRIDAATPARAEDRYVVTDLVVTLYSNNSVDLEIDSDRNNGLAPPDHSNVEDLSEDTADDESLCDDWVAAKDTATGRVHRIYNWLRMTAPAGVEQMLTLEAATTASGGTVSFSGFAVDSTTILQDKVQRLVRTVGPETGSVDAVPFLVNGDRVSSKMDDVRVKAVLLADNCAAQAARFQPQLFGTETLTVMKFNAEEETYGQSTIPVNPAVVTPDAHEVGGNVFAVDVGDYDHIPSAPEDWHNSDFVGGGIQPRIQPLPTNPPPQKFTPATIEVVWGRRIWWQAGNLLQTLCSTTPGSSLLVSPSDKGIIVDAADNLRVRDTGVPAWAANVGAEVQYRFGHPTESNHVDLSMFVANAVASLRSRAAPLQTFPVRFHVMRLTGTNGPVDISITANDISHLLVDVNRVWSQAGIALVPIALGQFDLEATPDPDCFDVLDNDTWTSAEDVAEINNDGQRIDVYIVRTMTNENVFQDDESISGTTRTRSMSGRDAILLAREFKDTEPPLGGNIIRSFDDMARTLAHELGHYLLDSTAHAEQLWNLMVEGDQPKKRDLREDDGSTIEKARNYCMEN